MIHLCPVCGVELQRPSWQDGLPSFDICPSCGIQFGYHDEGDGSIEMREKIYYLWRRMWEANGNQPLTREQADDVVKLAAGT